jgi:hypothetical protein
MSREEEIVHQQKLLATYRRTLAHYLTQQAALGAAHTPPGVAHGIGEARENITRIKGILRGWGLTVADEPDDDAPPASDRSSTAPAAAGSGVAIHIHGGDFRGANLPIGNTVGRDLHQQTGGATMSTFDQRGWNVAGNVYNIAGDLNMSANPDKSELLAALRQLQGEIAKAQDLPPDEGDDLKTNLDQAIKAVERPQPNKDRAVEKLSTMKKVIDGLKENVGSALALGNLIGQALLAAQNIHF